ncbi:MAG: hypothetical protein AAGK02_07270 [Pseudomonadota bacterium]
MTKKQIMIGAATIALASQAQAVHARVTYICPQLDTANSELQVRVSSGCMSTSTSYAGNDLELEVDQNYAQIRVTGDLQFNSGGRIQTADCMGRKDITLTAEGIEQRRYSVSYNGEWLDTLDLIENPKPDKCLNAGARGIQSGYDLAFKSAYKDWNNDPVSGWREWRGTGVLNLLAPVLDGHPEGEEGRPTAMIEMKQMQWRREASLRDPSHDPSPFIAVTITQHGYLDDSVSGGRYFAEVRMDEAGEWKLSGLWGQWMCARGVKAGQWSGEPCP